MPRWLWGAAEGLAFLAVCSLIGCRPAPPLILTFDAAPAQIDTGESTTLCWVVKGVDSVDIDQGIGKAAAVGNREVSPATTIAYTLTAANPAGTASKSVVIVVNQAQLPTPDSIAPVITNVSASSETEMSAVVSWLTDEPASSQVEYGRTVDYGSTTALDEQLVASHIVGLDSLEPRTFYHFRVKSTDQAGNEALSGDYTFATAAPKSPYVLELLSSEWGRRDEGHPTFETSVLFIRGTVRNASHATVRGMACTMQCWSGDTLVKSEVDVYPSHILQGYHFDFDIHTADDPAVDNVTIEFTDSLGDEISLIVE
ncbi:MAG: fibronectin type III domain-containing protein [Dehalococcoidia bacterium]|nr:fibronectin type III domain-containing protein [Dehalococcoidia bacterium]